MSDTDIHKNRYILVVDNNASDLFLASMLLQRFKYQVCTASTAGQALEMVSVAAPSLVTADLFLPGLSGMDLLSLFRQDPRTSSIPLIFLFPSGDKTAEKRCRAAGVAGCITKPFEVEDLYRTVQAAIESTPRANIRIHTSLSVTINDVPLDHVDGDCASVLSEHGMYVRMKNPYPRNEMLTVRLNLNGRLIIGDTTVLYSHTYGDGPFKEPGMGLKFLRISFEDQLFIRQFIRNEISKGISQSEILT